MTGTASANPAGRTPGFGTFTWLWATQSVSVIGTGLTFFATNIWLTQVLYPRPDQARQLAYALSANGLAFALPTVFFAPIAGAFADRHDRRRILFATDVLNAALALGLATLFARPAMGLAPVLLVMVAYCGTGAFHVAAFESSVAMLVPKEQLPRANAMVQSMMALPGLLAPASAALLIAIPVLARQGAVPGAVGAWLAGFRDGVPFAVLVDACSFLLAASALLVLAIPSPPRADLAGGARKSLWADIGEGVRYIRHRTPLLWLLGTFTAVNLLFSPVVVLLPLLTKFTLAADWKARGMTFEAALAAITTANSIGGLAGAIALSAWGGLKTHRLRGVLGSLVIGGFMIVWVGLSHSLFSAVAAVFCAGATLPMTNVHSQAIWQAQVPPELQGRVFSVRRLIAQFTYPIGTALGGVVAAALAPGLATALLGGAAAAFGVAQFMNPGLRHVEDKAALDAMAARRASA